MQKLGYESKNPHESLHNKIEKKKEFVEKMRKLLNQNYFTEEEEEIYRGSVDELKQLLKINAHYETEIGKHCGCNESTLHKY
jgi:negative regulator of replication initiation